MFLGTTSVVYVAAWQRMYGLTHSFMLFIHRHSPGQDWRPAADHSGWRRFRWPSAATPCLPHTRFLQPPCCKLPATHTGRLPKGYLQLYAYYSLPTTRRTSCLPPQRYYCAAHIYHTISVIVWMVSSRRQKHSRVAGAAWRTAAAAAMVAADAAGLWRWV